MKTLILFLLLLPLFIQAQTYVKVADKPEYEKYLKYCNVPTPLKVTQVGVITLLKVNGQYTDSVGNYIVKIPITIAWFKVGSTSMTVEPYQKLIYNTFFVPVQMRKPSITDFYTNWQTHKIP